ncbi:MAG: DNA polymerase III subunit delta [Clostridiales bacterium]|nr:DNA polymerase III subunit delta [Clostridiales bacterium]
MIKFLELREKLKSNVYNALCVFGNDGWLKKRAVENVCDAYGIVDDGFGVDRLESPTPDDLTLACLTPSMFCDKRLIVCQDFALPDAGAKLLDAKNRLSDLLKHADGSFCLLILTDSDKGFKDIAGVETVDCNRLDRASVIKWIESYCKRQNVAIDRLCADRIASYCLMDMARVAVETQKLIDYGQIDPESIDLLVHRDAEYVIFDLSGAIANKNATRALEIYRGLIARGEDARALFGLLYSFYRRVYYVKTSEYNSDEIASYLGVKSGAVTFARETAQRYKPMQLKRALDYLALADERLKSFVDEGEVMNILIMQLISL